MQDRVSLYPGRVKLVPVAGQENTYDMVRADSPTQEGDPLNKDTLLQDATAALFGLTADAVPDDVFALLKTLVDNAKSTADSKANIVLGSYTGTGTVGSGHPNSLTFPAPPKFLFITDFDDSRQNFWFYVSGLSKVNGFTSYSTNNVVGSGQCTVTVTGNTISWYSNGNYTHGQMNTKNAVYRYVAIY